MARCTLPGARCVAGSRPRKRHCSGSRRVAAQVGLEGFRVAVRLVEHCAEHEPGPREARSKRGRATQQCLGVRAAASCLASTPGRGCAWHRHCPRPRATRCAAYRSPRSLRPARRCSSASATLPRPASRSKNSSNAASASRPRPSAARASPKLLVRERQSAARGGWPARSTARRPRSAAASRARCPRSSCRCGKSGCREIGLADRSARRRSTAPACRERCPSSRR